MGKLIGDIKFTGRVGGLTFYPDKNGDIIVRGAAGPSADQIRHGDNFAGTRRNNKEFGRASSTGKLLRYAIPAITKYCGYTSLHTDLVTALKDVIATDPVNAWGERLVSAGKVELLEDFQWNKNLPLEAALNTECMGQIDPATGNMQVLIASFDPKKAIKAPDNASHFQLSAVAIAIYPEEGTKKVEIVTGPLTALKATPVKALTLDLAIDSAGYSFVLLGLAITFFETVNSKKQPVKGGAFQVLKAQKLNTKEKKKAAPKLKPEAIEPVQPVLQQSLFG